MAPVTRSQTRRLAAQQAQLLAQQPPLAQIAPVSAPLPPPPSSSPPVPAPTLPAEILNEILALACFNQYPKVAQRIRFNFSAVCRSFYQATPRHFIVVGARRALSLALVLKSGERGNSVESLVIDGVGDWDDLVGPAVRDENGVRIDSRGAKTATLLERCKKLKKLEILFGLRYGKEYADLLGKELRAAWERLEFLEDLNIVLSNPCVELDDFFRMLATFKHLKNFSLYNTSGFSTSQLSDITLHPLPFALYALTLDVTALPSDLLRSLVQSSKETLRKLTLRQSGREYDALETDFIDALRPIASRLWEFHFRVNVSWWIDGEFTAPLTDFTTEFAKFIETLVAVNALTFHSKFPIPPLFRSLKRLPSLRELDAKMMLAWGLEGMFEDLLDLVSSSATLRVLRTRNLWGANVQTLQDACSAVRISYQNDE